MTQHFGTPATSAPVVAETPESIKQKYEENPNTNAFTDANKTKLTSLTAVPNSVINQNGLLALRIWVGTQSQYDAVTPKNTDTLYVITL